MKPNAERLKDLFLAALSRPSPAERDAYLAEACQGDLELRQQVEGLLQAHEQAGAFLGPAGKPPVAPGLTERPGTLIGRYKLLELIGEGGFGVVWMAEQEEPVRRRVALKIIKPGMDTKQVLARFEAERQALAMMDHPSIARVFDGGATETGRPYFVMELVRGVRITDYCDANKLSMRERLLLFIQVCQAVQHAHQKGIIHRDLKPSNILVTEVDGAPVPKIIDFGVAKATQARLTALTLFTGLHQMIGTPSYMSPEQAGLGALDMDTRSDIYGLGVLLYELLTGQTPLAQAELEKAGLEEVLRLIRERDPQKPSTRLSTLTREQLTTIAAQRGAEPVRLNRLLSGDLDWIVMKALEKDRRRRYDTAGDLAADLVRHLHNEPVIARPPSTCYRLQKAWRRNQPAFATAILVATVLLAGTGVSVWQAVRATRAEALAKQRLAESETLAKSFSEMVQHSSKVGMMNNNVPVFAFDAVGRNASIELQERMLAYNRKVHGPESPDTITAMEKLALFYEAAQRLDEAIQLREKVLALRRKAGDPADPATINAFKTLAFAYCNAGRSREAIALMTELFGLAPTDTASSQKLAVWLAWFGQDAAYEAIRHRLLEEAEKIKDGEVEKALDRAAKSYCLRPATNTADLAKALQLAQRALAQDKAGHSWRPWFQMAVGLAQYRNGQLAAAEQSLVAAEQGLPPARHDLLSVAKFFRVMSLWRQNRPDEARQLFNEAEAQMPPFPKDEQRPYADRHAPDPEPLIGWLAYKEAKAMLPGRQAGPLHPGPPDRADGPDAGSPR